MKEYLINAIATSQNEKFEKTLVKGLRRKGFEFKDKAELEVFVVENCRCEHTTCSSDSTYFVNDIPFMNKHEMKTFYEGIGTATMSYWYTFL